MTTIFRSTFGDPSRPTHQTVSYKRHGERFFERANVLVTVTEPLTATEIAELLSGAAESLMTESTKFGDEGSAAPKQTCPIRVRCGGCIDGTCPGHDVMTFATTPEQAEGSNALRDGLFEEVERLRNENASYRSVLASVGTSFDGTAKLVKDMTSLRDLRSDVREFLGEHTVADASWLAPLFRAYKKTADLGE